MDNVTAILRNFSSSNNNSKWEISYDLPLPRKNFFLFYANGNCKDNKGYVSIIFSTFEKVGIETLSYFCGEIICYVSVVDFAGNKRFTQTVVLSLDLFRYPGMDFGLERYLKRETLLNDPAELLPDDCLTICVDVDRRHLDSDVLTSADSNFTLPFCKNETGLSILLDTDFGRELYRVSEVFRFASDVPMMESRTRMVSIPIEESILFLQIWRIFVSPEEFDMFMSMICDLYRVADKYDIQPVIEMCRQFVKAFLIEADYLNLREDAGESFTAILKLIEDYRDDDLKETLQTYLESKENFGTNYCALRKHLKKKLHTDWKCEIKDRSPYIDYYVKMRRRIIPPEFQFYQ